MSQPIEIALGEKNVLQSIEMAFRTDIPVSQPREIAFGETLLWRSQ